ncbi:BTAD domain-containing putative transcriptional regulator [Streptosporangium oxazolinicum]|uniref:BTAD domain-containing putative transcriptional regulator n=1 Tax=Streptosporangium oxazolinicum TaxID=909287 RepID=A0ABP8ATJ6_9ACTN
MRFRVLGPVELWRDGHSITVVGEKQRTLLAVLVMNAGRTVSQDQLLTALWGADHPSSARKRLHNYVWSLRRLLSDSDALPRMPTGYRLRISPDDSDLEVFLTTTSEGRRLLAAGDIPQAAQRFHHALALWRGPALTGTNAELQATEGIALDEQRLTVLVERISADLALGRHGELIGELRRLVADHPLHEPLRGQLMLALYRVGRQSETLTVFRDLRRALNTELGTEPGPELQRLHQRVLATDPELHLTAPATPSEVERTAPHTTADSTAPADDPSPAVEVTGLCQLPRAIGDFTSREDEIERLVQGAVEDTDSAVVIEAIDGMAGVGKTALAVHVAHRLATRFPDGQLFLDLHGHTPGRRPVTPLEALHTLLRATGMAREKIPDDLEEAAALWRSAAARRRMLVVLDNAATAGQVRPLLLGRPGSHIVITSRRRLADLDDVTVLSLDVLSRAEAVALFTRIVGVERAHAERRAVDEVAALCGYLPLALRIAAARLLHRPAWTVRDLATRLGDQRGRLRELRTGDRDVAAAFTVSYEQLTAVQQRVFRLLGLIPGDDFDAHAAAALTGSSLVESESVLEELLDAHLLQQHTAGRYGFHDLLRDYAQQTCRATESENERGDAANRLRAYYLATATLTVRILGYSGYHQSLSEPVASAESPAITTSDQAAAWLDAERGNLLAAALVVHDAWVVDMSMTLWQYLFYHAHYGEALTLHRHASDVAQQVGDQKAHIQMLINLGITFWKNARYEQALQHHRQALDLAHQIGDRDMQSRALINLGITCAVMGDYEKSNGYLERSLTLSRESGNRRRESRNLLNIGNNYERMGRYRFALRYQEQALACARGIEDQATESRALGSLAYTYSRLGFYELAVSHSLPALTVARQTGDRGWEADMLNNLGVAYVGLCRYQEALSCYRQSLALSREIGSRSSQAETLGELGNFYLQLGRYSEAQDHHQQGLAMVDETGDLVTKTVVLNGLGQAACATGDPAKALDYHHQALALAESVGHLHGQAHAHRGIGDALYRTKHPKAAESWQQALDIFTEIGAPERKSLREYLATKNGIDSFRALRGPSMPDNAQQ